MCMCVILVLLKITKAAKICGIDYVCVCFLFFVFLVYWGLLLHKYILHAFQSLCVLSLPSSIDCQISEDSINVVDETKKKGSG